MRRALLFLSTFFVLIFGFVPGVSSQSGESLGSWRIMPLLTKDTSVPGSPGTFREFGETYVMEDFLAFWGHFGDGAKDWALFSLKDGKLSRILTDDTDLAVPDGRNIKVNRLPVRFSPTIHAGKRMLYISARNPDHVYGWNGENLTRVLGGGEILTIAGVPYQVKRSTVLDVNESGQALLYWDSSKPEAEGWILHDGVNFSPLWKEGDPLPGRPPEERIKNLSSGPICIYGCVPSPRLLRDGSLLAVVEKTTGGTALVRISRSQTEILDGSPKKILAAERLDYVADVSKEVTKNGRTVLDFGLLLHSAGKSSLQEGVPVDVPYTDFKSHVEHGLPLEVLLMPEVAKTLEKVAKHSKEGENLAIVISVINTDNVRFGYDNAMFLAPDSSRALVTVWVSTVEQKSKSGGFKNEISAVSFPGVYFLDDHGLARLAWESALGLNAASVPGALHSRVTGFNAGIAARMDHDVPVERIRLRKLAGPVPGIRVDLPAVGSGSRRWFVPAASADGKLVREPEFNVGGRTVTVADVLAWKGPNAALVSLDDGYFMLERVAPKAEK